LFWRAEVNKEVNGNEERRRGMMIGWRNKRNGEKDRRRR
jgi:hypothetical protein